MSLLITPVSKFDEPVPLVSGCTSGFWEMGCRLRGLALASRSGQPCCRRVACRDDGLCRAFRVFHGLATMLIYVPLSKGYVTHAAMLLWAVLSDGCGGDASCDGYSLEFLTGDGCRNLPCRVAGLLRLKEALPLLHERFGSAAAMVTLVGRGENVRFLVLFGMVQCALCAENSVPEAPSKRPTVFTRWSRLRATTSLSLRARWWTARARTCLTFQRRLACGVWTSTSSCTSCLSMASRRGFVWRDATVGCS